VWRTTWEIVESNPDFPQQPYLFTVYTEHYLTAQAIAIRRQVDSTEKHHQTACRLLRLLETGAAELTREWFVSLFRDAEMMWMGNNTFNHFADSEHAPTVSAQWLASRRKDLEDIATPVRQFVNKRVAHLDHRPVAIARVSDLDAAMDLLREVVMELHLLLRATDLLDPEPTVQFDWTRDLRVPWLQTEYLGSGDGTKTVPTSTAYSDGDTVSMVDGDYVVVGDSRPLTDKPGQFATTIRRPL